MCVASKLDHVIFPVFQFRCPARVVVLVFATVPLLQPDRQMTMWSATWPKEIRRLADQYLENAEEETVYVKVGSTDLTANSDIQQNFHICRSGNKRQL